MLTTHATGPSGAYTVIASGVFSGRGKATTQSARVLKVTIGSGTFLVHHANSASNPVKPPTTNQQTCFLSVTTKAGAYSLSDGTGKYAGMTGGGQALITFSGKFAKKGGKCDFSQSARPVQGTTTTVVHAAGHVKL
jgi:hypothetical protein